MFIDEDVICESVGKICIIIVNHKKKVSRSWILEIKFVKFFLSQVQIIIPYTSQDTPSPFHSSFNDDRNGRVMGQNLPRKVPSRSQFDHFDDNVLAQESKTFSVTSLPDISSSVKPITEKGKNNSIDVQRLQKNIDNWTIQVWNFISN